MLARQAIRIIKGKNIENNLLFNEGNITVQDERAMLTATFYGPSSKFKSIRSL